MKLIPLSTAATMASVYAASVRGSGWPRYVPIPIEESTSSPALRKCSSAACSHHLSAKRFVPSVVARSLMSCVDLLRYLSWREPIPVRQALEEPRAAHTRASFCDRARLFRERKFRLHEDCCKTSERAKRDVR